jgi:transposase-like protein
VVLNHAAAKAVAYGEAKALCWKKKCYEMIRKLRWERGVRCVKCTNRNVKKNGIEKDGRQNYSCNNCGKYFDDVTDTIFSGQHQSVKIWVLCMYLMGLNLSNLQIAKELDLCESDVQSMTTRLREGIEKKAEDESVVLGGSVEMDEVYITAGHKGNPASVKKTAKREKKPFKGGKRQRYIGERENSSIRNDKEIRICSHQNAA